MEKVLATVAIAVYEYTSRYPERSIIFSGSTTARTRLYRMAIVKNFEELSADFIIYGVVEHNGGASRVPFVSNKEYLAFIVERKFLKLGL